MSEVLTAIKKIDKGFDGVGKRLDTVDKKFGELDTRVKKIEVWGEKAATNAERLYAQPKDNEEVRFGFKNFGHLCHEVYHSGISKRATETLTKAYNSEMVQKAATGMGELVGSDGGFLVPPDFAMKIMERVYSDAGLLERTDKYTTSANNMTFPRNAETSRATGSRWGGVRAYWLGEGSKGTESRPKFGQLKLNLHKLMCLGVVTEELLSDAGATAIDQYLFRVFSDEIQFLVGDAIVNGTGAGMPLGILEANCTVAVDKESGQAEKTIVHNNIVKMWARMWAPSRMNAVWLINQDTEPQLHTMSIGVGTAGQPSYLPPGGLSVSPYATLLGRPVIPTEFNSTLGTKGDIILADLGQMISLTKGGGMQNAVSMHFYFDTDEQAFRVTFRLDAQPWWAAPLTPFKGTNTQSCFVVLNDRA